MAATRLVLVGGGHAHLLVLRALGRVAEQGMAVTVVTPSRYSTYSGMVPGALAGLYRLPDAQVDVAALAGRAGAACVIAAVVALDATRRALRLSDGTELPYDFASFNIGSESPPAPADADAPVVRLKPIDEAIRRLDAALCAATPPNRIVVVGGGAGGTEIAFALAARRQRGAASTLTLCDSEDRPVIERGSRTAAVVERALGRHEIGFRGGVRAEHIGTAGVGLTGGTTLPADLVVWATGAGRTRVFADAALSVDRRGALLVDATLRSPAHPELFAAGDCAALLTHPALPKAGVYAVRQAPVLAHNLRAAVRGAPLGAYRPQRRFLALLNTCDQRAVLSYGGAAWHGRAAWWLKDWIDRRFVAQFL